MQKESLFLILLVRIGCAVFAQNVTIGNQLWMTKNLDVSTFRNGDPIPEAKTRQEWEKAGENKQPAWCYYNNDPNNGAKYGKLYNWHAVSDLRGLAPIGYHIPTHKEWDLLTDYLGGLIYSGTKMKSKNGWDDDPTGGSKTCPSCENWNAEYRSKVPCHICKDTRLVDAPCSGNGTNSSGFSGLPGGYRNILGTFSDAGKSGYWWSSTISWTISAWYRGLRHSWFIVDRETTTMGMGYSVRCIKD